jgi:hypothetical protein
MVVLFGENMPVPEVDQIAPLAMVYEPFRVTFELFEQTETFDPALAVGACVKVTVS